MARPVGSHGCDNDLWVGAKTLPSHGPSLPPRVAINVKALSIDDYNHTKSGQMGSTPQLTAIKFTNSPWPGDKLPLRVRGSFSQRIFLGDGNFSFPSSAQVFFC